jgi:hypothetical protein
VVERVLEAPALRRVRHSRHEEEVLWSPDKGCSLQLDNGGKITSNVAEDHRAGDHEIPRVMVQHDRAIAAFQAFPAVVPMAESLRASFVLFLSRASASSALYRDLLFPWR